jgi:hypothetical protein
MTDITEQDDLEVVPPGIVAGSPPLVVVLVGLAGEVLHGRACAAAGHGELDVGSNPLLMQSIAATNRSVIVSSTDSQIATAAYPASASRMIYRPDLHANPRTTTRHDQVVRSQPDRHWTTSLAAYMASGHL